MANALSYVPRAAIFLAGIAVGALTGSRREPSGADSGSVQDLKRSVSELEADETKLMPDENHSGRF